MKTTSGLVIASLRPSTYHKLYDSALRSLRPCRKVVLISRSETSSFLAPCALQARLQMLLPSSIVPLSIGMGRVTACVLRGCRALSLRSPFSPAHLGSPFHPPTHRLLCKSFTRDAPLSQVAMARRRVRRSVRTESGANQVGGAKQRQGHAVTLSLKQGLPPPMPYYFVNSLTR